MPTLTQTEKGNSGAKQPETHDVRYIAFRIPAELRKALRQFALDKEISVQEACTRAIRALVNS